MIGGHLFRVCFMTMSQVRPLILLRQGEVHGEISLKRQYRIRKGKMEYMIESSVTVHDDILQKSSVPMQTTR